MDTRRNWSNIPDPYTTLQVSPNAEQEVIEAAYRRLARKYHPDVNPTPKATEKMRDLNIAYEILSNPYQRRSYDQWKEAQTFETIYAEETKTGEGTHPQEAYRPAMRKGKSWWRWPLVLFSGLGAYVGIQLAGWLLLLVLTYVPSPGGIIISREGQEYGLTAFLLREFGLSHYVETALKYIGGPWAFVSAGVAIAPRHKFETGLVLSLIQMAVLGLEILYVPGLISQGLTWGEGYRGSAPLWWVISTSSLGIVVLTLKVIRLHRKHQN